MINFWMKEPEKFRVIDQTEIESVEIYRNPIRLAIQDCLDWIADEKNNRHIITLPYGIVKINVKILAKSHLF